jgi:hypothetical protein
METTVLLCRLNGDCGRTVECRGDTDSGRRTKEVRIFSSVQRDGKGEETGFSSGFPASF